MRLQSALYERKATAGEKIGRIKEKKTRMVDFLGKLLFLELPD